MKDKELDPFESAGESSRKMPPLRDWIGLLWCHVHRSLLETQVPSTFRSTNSYRVVVHNPCYKDL